MQKTRTGLNLSVFGNVQQLFKLDTGAQCNVLPKAASDMITTKPLQSSSAKLESYTKTRIKPVGKYELPCWVCGLEYQVCFEVVDGKRALQQIVQEPQCFQLWTQKRHSTKSS